LSHILGKGGESTSAKSYSVNTDTAEANVSIPLRLKGSVNAVWHYTVESPGFKSFEDSAVISTGEQMTLALMDAKVSRLREGA
jgi:hypothetical protein